ncbi:MAG TPA: methyl-accepting chemotaxis protein [Afifellaceae bacterium]|nr:methyl-accepting chemotaxis protein [Afifellaceae bacterium]
MARTLARFKAAARNRDHSGNGKDRSGRRKGALAFGIRSKLFLSIGTLVLFTAAAIGLSMLAFRLAQSEFRNFNEVELPSMVDAGALAIASTDITIASSKLIDADTEATREAAVKELRKAVLELVDTNKSATARHSNQQAFQALGETADAFVVRLDDLDRLTKRRIELASEKHAKMDILFATHEGLTNLLTPQVDDAYFEVVIGGENAARDASDIVDTILNKDMVVVRHLLTLRSDINSAAGAISAYILTDDIASAKIFEDRIVSSMRHVTETVDRLKDESFSVGFATDIAELGEIATKVLSLSAASGGRLFFGANGWLERLFTVHKAIDNATIKAIDDAVFELTIDGESAVEKNVSIISDLLENQVGVLRTSQESIATLHNFAALLVQGALTEDPSIIVPLQDRSTSMIESLRTMFATFENIDSTDRLDKLAALSRPSDGLMALRTEELQTTDAVNRIIEQVFNDISQINGIVEQIVLERQQSIAESSADISANLATKSTILLLLGLVMLAAAAAICLLVVHRGLMQPLTKLIGSIRQLAEGDLEVAIEHTGRSDEIGEMSRSLDVFKDNARQVETLGREQDEIRQRAQEERRKMMTELRESIGAVVDAAARGDFSRRVEVTFGEPDLDAMSEAVNKLTYSVELGLNETSSVLSALAQGNLGERVTGNYEGAFLDLRTDVNAMADQISTIAERIALVTAAVRGATNEISSGITDLSTRTEHQASYLEETTASMEELSATVHQNMRNGQEANELAAAARGTAEKGGEVAEKAADAMQNIEQSSRRITEIVGLIEEIAFQTNLLALNAAVEAARAGEAGRGFSVVASEVRGLAQRAGQASKDIRNLILTADGHVREGVELVSNAGSSLSEIVASVKKVSDFIAEIATSGEEQMTGIEQVSNAIVSMDSMTQQNAALVEETTTSMQSALMQVEDLGQAIAFFRTSGETGSGEDQEPAEALAG